MVKNSLLVLLTQYIPLCELIHCYNLLEEERKNLMIFIKELLMGSCLGSCYLL